MSAMSFERFFTGFMNYAIWCTPPVLFIVFLILFIINFRKIRKEKARPAKAITFGCLSGFFLMTTVGEVLLVLLLAAAVSHM